MASSDEEAARGLLSAAAVRGRAHEMLDLALDGKVDGWRVDLDRLPETARFVAEVIRDQYPDLKVPFHARWRHFVFGGRDLWAEMGSGIADPDARARAVTSVFRPKTMSASVRSPSISTRDSSSPLTKRRSQLQKASNPSSIFGPGPHSLVMDSPA